MLINSIRGRFLVWLAFLLVILLTGFGVTAYQLHRTNQFARIDEELERRLAPVDTAVNGIRRPPGGARGARRFQEPLPRERGLPPEMRLRPEFRPPPEQRPPPPEGWMGGATNGFPLRLGPREVRLPPEVFNLFGGTEGPVFHLAVWSRNGNLVRHPSDGSDAPPLPDRRTDDLVPVTRMRGEFREMYRFNEVGECILVGRSIADDLGAMRRFGWWLALAGGGVLALGLGGGWRLVGNALRPVAQISSAATRIADGNLGERIQVTDTDNELDRLAAILNSTFARLEDAFAQQKQFTGDAAHELRTPLAVLITEVQTILARERPAAEYRESLKTCLEVAQQMRRLTESLLELSRFDAGQAPIAREPVDLRGLTAECAAMIRPLAQAREVTVSCEGEPVECLGDAQRLGQVVTNLLMNAIAYNRPGGTVTVRTAQANGQAVLEVADTGVGIAVADLPHIFDRFYRADKARARTEGHSGLGLAIVQAIVALHGGTIAVSSEEGKGSVFSVRLPRAVGGEDPSQGQGDAPGASGSRGAARLTAFLA